MQLRAYLQDKYQSLLATHTFFIYFERKTCVGDPLDRQFMCQANCQIREVLREVLASEFVTQIQSLAYSDVSQFSSTLWSIANYGNSPVISLTDIELDEEASNLGIGIPEPILNPVLSGKKTALVYRVGC